LYRPKSGHQFIGAHHPQEAALFTGCCHPHRGSRPSSATPKQRCLTTDEAARTLTFISSQARHSFGQTTRTRNNNQRAVYRRADMPSRTARWFASSHSASALQLV
jgi:hypothetical protein